MNGLVTRYWHSLSPALQRYYRASAWPSLAFIALAVLHEWTARKTGLATGVRMLVAPAPVVMMAWLFVHYLRFLRDCDELSFLGDGVYRIEALDTVTEASDEIAESDSSDPEYTAEIYETVVGTRSLPVAFRVGMLARYNHTCPISGVDHDRLLDVAHVLPWSDYPEHRTDPGNVLLLSRTHHAAFDAGLFTLDGSCRLQVNPEFETESELLQRTLLDRAGERIELPVDTVAMSGRLREHNNRHLDWWKQ